MFAQFNGTIKLLQIYGRYGESRFASLCCAGYYKWWHRHSVLKVMMWWCLHFFNKQRKILNSVTDIFCIGEYNKTLGLSIKKYRYWLVQVF